MSDPKSDDRPETPDDADGTAVRGDEDLTTAPPASTGPEEGAAAPASAAAEQEPHTTDDEPAGADDAATPEAPEAPEAPEDLSDPAVDDPDDVPQDDASLDENPLDVDPHDEDPSDDDARADDEPATDVEVHPGTEVPHEGDDPRDGKVPEAEPLAQGPHPAHLALDHDEPVSAAPGNTRATDVDPPDEDPGVAGEPASAAGSTSTSGWRRLGAALRPRSSRSQVLAGVLCAALGFALVVQVQQSASDQLSSARQEDLVRLLDEVTDRAQQLGDEVSGLEATRDELESGSGQARSALELAEQRAESEGILSGRLPAQGPGVRVTIQDPEGALKASQMFNVLEELRNAGAEVVELNGVRLVTSTWFEDEGDAIVVDGTALSSPYEWTVIGDPETMDRALEIPGGALATVRTAGAEASTAREDEVKIMAVTPPQQPEHAKPERENG